MNDLSQKELLSLRACFLKQRQSLPLHAKLRITESRLKMAEIHAEGNLYLSSSGGVDSTVLTHIGRRVIPNVPVVFIDTGLEYPENRALMKTVRDVTWLRPKMTFQKVIQKYGYPVISKDVAQKVYELRHSQSEVLRTTRLYGDTKGNGKLSECWKYLVDAPFKISHKCCYYLKHQPAKQYEKETGRMPVIGVMANESFNRKSEYLRNGGCNMFHGGREKSEPLAFWTKADIWAYIREFHLPYSAVYDMGYPRTGCMFCGFSVHLEDADMFAKNKFQLMRQTHPKQYAFCMETLGLREVLSYLNIPY